MSSNKVALERVPFTNNLGHEMEPGDNVLVITTCWKTTYIKAGKYLGKKRDSVSVEVDEYRTKLLHKVTREEYDYNHKFVNPYPRITTSYPDTSYDWKTLTRRVPSAEEVTAYEEARKVYDKEKEVYDAEWQAYRDQFESVKIPYKRKTTLRLNRVYPLNMKVIDLAGSRF